MITTIKSDKLIVSVNANGAELSSIKTADNTEYLWQAGEVWNRKAPILFPFVCNFTAKKYRAGGVELQSPSNHGFARDSVFELVSSNEHSVTYKLSSSEKTKATYPYDFNLFVVYSVKGNAISVSYSVENTDNKDIYFYIGGHPGFNCPINNEGSFDDWYIEYDKNENIRQTNSDIDRDILVNENKLCLSRELFKFDVILKDAPASKAITLKSDKSDKSVRLEYPDGECIAVWSPYNENATFVCLEPWSSVPAYFDDAFENIEDKPHAVKLESNKKYTFEYKIIIE